MNEIHIVKVSQELKLQPRQVAATAQLLQEGGTVPFISRYRKEITGSLDEVAITQIRDRLTQLLELDQRRVTILKSLEERSLLTDELRTAIEKADTMAALEDIYLPYRPKRRTKAMIAREQGLEPLADFILQNQNHDQPVEEAKKFVSTEKGVASPEAALAGARDIVAEKINDDALARKTMRELYWSKSLVRSKVLTEKIEEGAKFKDYFDWSEPIGSIPSHRMLAIRRGETEGVLMMRINPPEEEAISALEPLFINGKGACAQQVKLAVQDCYKRLLGFSMEAEIRMESKKRADEEAIRVFSDNLRELLLAPALGQKNVMAIDPGFRTGCKTVCLDRQGKLLYQDVIYPTQSDHRLNEAATMVRKMCEKFNIEAIAIGNGTAGRETETFIRGIGLAKNIIIVMVNESGASIYSASDVAREEFPDQDITVRGSVSIGRRLMDPLAELVKLDPKSIGVGQYQHDVDQLALKHSLDDIVMSCVNAVGVELNTASRQLLAYVSGLGPQLAGNIVAYRNENGPFTARSDLKKVPRLGPKAFEQSAGFLRIRESSHPLDSSAVHPEAYPIVEKMAQDLQCGVVDLIKNPGVRQKIVPTKYVTEKVGLPTLSDILSELAKPGRDPRQQFEAFSFKEGVDKIESLKPGMKLPGVVTNVTAFGAFVDIGVHQDGLVHISQLSDQFIKNPSEVVKVQQRVTVTVVEIDIPRKRIALSMKSNPDLVPAARGNTGPRPGAPGKPINKTPPPPANDWFSAALAKGQKKG